MLTTILLSALCFFSCAKSLLRPTVGLIAFYGFTVLNPKWTWRYTIDTSLPFQTSIIICTMIGICLTGFKHPLISKQTKRCVISLIGFFALCFVSQQTSVSPESGEYFLSILFKALFTSFLTMIFLSSSQDAKTLLIVALLGNAYHAFQINLSAMASGGTIFLHLGYGGLNNNTYSLLTMPMLGVALAFGLWEKTLWRKLAFLSIAILQIHMLMLLESRSCLLGLVVMAFLALWKMPKTRVNLKITLIGFACIVALAGTPAFAIDVRKKKQACRKLTN